MAVLEGTVAGLEAYERDLLARLRREAREAANALVGDGEPMNEDPGDGANAGDAGGGAAGPGENAGEGEGEGEGEKKKRKKKKKRALSPEV